MSHTDPSLTPTEAACERHENSFPLLTPRTNENAKEANRCGADDLVVYVEFAQQLELELRDALAIIAQCERELFLWGSTCYSAAHQEARRFLAKARAIRDERLACPAPARNHQ